MYCQSCFRASAIFSFFCAAPLITKRTKVIFCFQSLLVSWKFVTQFSCIKFKFFSFASLRTKKWFVSSYVGFEPATSGSEVHRAIHCNSDNSSLKFCYFQIIVCQKFFLSSSEGIETSSSCVEALSAMHCATRTCIRTRFLLTFSPFHQTRLSCFLNPMLGFLLLSELHVVLLY